MLKINESKNLNAPIIIDGQHVINLSATISLNNHNTRVSHSVTDHAIYMANKVECRASIAKFLDRVYEIEDEMFKVEV